MKPRLQDAFPAGAVGLDALWAAVEATWPDAGMFVVDEHQTVRAFSAGAERLLGFQAKDVVGEHCRKSNRCQTCMVGCGLKDRRTVNDAPLTLYRDDGSAVAVRKTARAFIDEDGTFRGGIEILVPDARPQAEGGADGKAPPVSMGLPIIDDAIDATVQRSGILTRDPAMRRLLQMVENVAKTDVTVLLRGESGSGKELFARLVHESSHRASGPFLAVNCAAVAPSLLESELFGHEKGSFTGALTTHHGFFERADSGTLFLDEVAELPLELQAKLLRVLETRTFFRVGGHKPVSVDVRVVSATHRALRQEATAGRFREDLLYRLRVVPIYLPPLRERKTDIPLLVEHFVARLNAAGAARRGRQVERVDPDAMRALLSWSFPGNVRELKNTIEYAFAVGSGPVLHKDDLPPEMLVPVPVGMPTTTPTGPTPGTATATTATLATRRATPSAPSSGPTVPRQRGRPKQPVDAREHERIESALTQTGGDVGAAATLLGMSRATLWRKRQQLLQQQQTSASR
jgi:transcriptional regulator with PAS, ATPase and Fis domain